ncbi:uncharacterized protein AB675_8148 [Cyphellophora attinorum]|uniref:Tachykinin family protein n=1 Tax=Cyphellophora attinorum TaxID=1664694 RepID=A0A0N0NNE1_9EURO|nr:uncharacterized protein AB675_8148 [Phialophora attinorum]KPI41269.1 hypothetical protein AB675_8148 [Phialophora attinorum]
MKVPGPAHKQHTAPVVRTRKRKQHRTESDEFSKSLGADDVDKLFFVPYQLPGTARRDVELVDAARRSYVARRSHRNGGNTVFLAEVATNTSSVKDKPYEATISAATAPNTVQLPSPVSKLSPTDPFSVFNYSIDLEAGRAIRYFQTNWAESAFQSATSHLHRSDNHATTSVVVQQVMSDNMCAHAFLAAVNRRMFVMHDASVLAERHANLAMAQLKKEIGRTDAIVVNQHIAVVMLFLSAYETYCFNLEGARIHLAAMEKVYGHHGLKGYLQRLCCNIDLFSAASLVAPPIFKQTSQSLCAWPNLDKSAASHFDDYTDVLGRKLCTVIDDIVALANNVDRFRHEALPTGLKQTASHMIARSEELTFRVLELMPCGNKLMECTVIALLMWLSYLPTSLMSYSPGFVPSDSFLKLVPGRGTRLGLALRQCKLATTLELWILAVGIICSVDSDDVQYCAINFIQLAKSLGIVSVRESLWQFLWFDTFDLIDSDVLDRLLDSETATTALQTIVGWASMTRTRQLPMGDEKSISVRLTNRPSNCFRLGA